jgi:hypothetical protein
MKFLFEKLSATIGVTEILSRIPACPDLNTHRAALKRGVQVCHPLPMGMIEPFSDPKNSSQTPDHTLVVVTQRSVRDVMPRRLRLSVVIANYCGHNGSIPALQARNVAIKHKILAMFVMPAMADHVADIVEQRPSF